MKLVTTEAVLTALCQHCDSHIEMCEDCGMREIIESVPSAWISVEDRLPLYGQDVLAARMYGADVDGWAYEIVIAHISNIRDSVYWNATNITHWMPLPDAPEVDE